MQDQAGIGNGWMFGAATTDPLVPTVTSDHPIRSGKITLDWTTDQNWVA